MDRIPPEVLLNAYAQGIFPMAEQGEILWFAPRNRGLIPLDDRFHISKNLRKLLRRKPFEIRWNTAFREVMKGCAEREETWIDEAILDSYEELHHRQLAWSVECWDEQGLQGGLYGVRMARAFFGESMFSRKKDASKVALVALVQCLRDDGAILLDTQWMTDHLRTFGGYEVTRGIYHEMLAEALEEKPQILSQNPAQL